MKKIILCLFLVITATPTFAVTAFWTGKSEQIQTVTYQWAWNCEYNYAGRMFWKVFKNSCPNSIEVQ